MALYAAAEVTEEMEPRPAIDGKPIAVRWRWIAQSPWWYFETEEAVAGFDAAPATYPNGVPLLETIAPWQEPQP